jgi:hypothetical protein
MTQLESVLVRLIRQTASVMARQARPVMRNTSLVVVKNSRDSPNSKLPNVARSSSGWVTPRPDAPPVSHPIENTTFSMPIWITSDATEKYSPVTTSEARPPAIDTAMHSPTPTRMPMTVLPAEPPLAWKAKK